MRFIRNVLVKVSARARSVCDIRSISVWLATIYMFAGIGAPATAIADSSLNSNSAIGINLAQINYYSGELPFLNIFKTGSAWFTQSPSSFETNEEQYLNLDADGWPISLTALNEPTTQNYTSVGVLILRNLPQTPNGYYPAGQYVVTYSGQGTLSYGLDAALVTHSPGRDVINVANPSQGGIYIQILATDPNNIRNYVRNIQVVKAENQALLNAGKIFSPSFLALFQNFRNVRFMDWSMTNYSTLSSWANRPLVSNAFWTGPYGVPIEAEIELANELGVDAWFNIPAQADDDYVTEMATLVYNRLGPSQKAYVEYTNEAWNSRFPSNTYTMTQGTAMFPGALNQYYAGWEWYGVRVAQIGDIWYSVYGNTAFQSNVVVVMSGQAANTAILQEELTTPDWSAGPAVNHHIGAIAIAPYFFETPSATDLATMLAMPDGGLTSLFSTVYSQAGFSSVPAGGQIAEVTPWIGDHAKLAASYNLPLVAYEGGQNLQGFPNFASGSPSLNLMIAANRDARMGYAYTTYLNTWKVQGGTLFMHYNDVYSPNQYGEWGLLESIFQTTTPLSSAPPKWQAVQNFMSANTCWWTGCAGTVSNASICPIL